MSEKKEGSEVSIKGYYPSRLNINLEISSNGEKTLKFKEWHDYAGREQFEVISNQTKITSNTIMQQYQHLGLNVKFQENLEEKSFEITYLGKDVRPAINAIFFELMPQLISNEKDAVNTIDLLFQAIKFCLSSQIIQPYTQKFCPDCGEPKDKLYGVIDKNDHMKAKFVCEKCMLKKRYGLIMTKAKASG